METLSKLPQVAQLELLELVFSYSKIYTSNNSKKKLVCLDNSRRIGFLSSQGIQETLLELRSKEKSISALPLKEYKNGLLLGATSLRIHTISTAATNTGHSHVCLYSAPEVNSSMACVHFLKGISPDIRAPCTSPLPYHDCNQIFKYTLYLLRNNVTFVVCLVLKT